MGEGTQMEWETQAAREAIAEWNKRAPSGSASLQQTGESK
jgi:hypothetical protein